jgi:hypothetical protein
VNFGCGHLTRSLGSVADPIPSRGMQQRYDSVNLMFLEILSILKHIDKNSINT